MKNLHYGFSILILFYFSININAFGNSNNQELESVLPFEIELRGLSQKIEDVQHSFPSIKVLVQKDSIEITVGQTEKYYTLFDSTEFTKLIPYLTLDDFKSNKHYLNPHLPGRIIKLRKKDQGIIFTKTISSFKRRDIEVEYLVMDSIDIFKSYHLSRIANEIAIPFIKDKVNKENMITAKSMRDLSLLRFHQKLKNVHISNQFLPMQVNYLSSLLQLEN